MTMGHGHVTPNANGTKARCGGPALCSRCAVELAAERAKHQGLAEGLGKPAACNLASHVHLANENAKLRENMALIQKRNLTLEFHTTKIETENDKLTSLLKRYMKRDSLGAWWEIPRA